MSKLATLISYALILLLLTSSGLFSATTVLVIAHSKVPVDTITKVDLRDIYLGDIRQWKDGTEIVVVDTKPRNKTKECFYSYIGKSPSRMKSIWIKKLLSGEGNPPEVVESDTDAVHKVASTPGAIGFVTKGTPLDSVRVIAEIVDDGD